MENNFGSIQELFSVPLYTTELDLDINEITGFCNNLKKNGESRDISNLGGFQSEIDMQGDLIRPLVEAVEHHSQLFAGTFINSKPLFMASMWLNVNGYKHSNLSHRHPNSDISGSYYVKVPKDSGAISFEHPALEVMSYYEVNQSIDESTKWNSTTWLFEPKENELYLFPSWLKHSVKLNENKSEDRISISFNLNSVTTKTLNKRCPCNDN